MATLYQQREPTAGSTGPEAEPDLPIQDIYGNEITEAVARYKFDPEGTAHEEHSPATEVPRLTPPTT